MIRALIRWLFLMCSVTAVALSYILLDGLEITDYNCTVKRRRKQKDIEQCVLKKYLNKISKQVNNGSGA